MKGVLSIIAVLAAIIAVASLFQVNSAIHEIRTALAVLVCVNAAGFAAVLSEKG